MGFAVAADAYDRFMGRYSTRLAPAFAAFSGVTAGQRVLDVGCGPGSLSAELVERLGATAVSAVDPSESFVAAARARQPGVDVRIAPAEDLPYADDAFDATLAQLVVHFMTNPVAGLEEMRRVTRVGGVVAACVWDLAGGRAPVSPFWRAADELHGGVEGESARAGACAGDLAALFEAAGLGAVEEETLSVAVDHESFDDWWEPFTLGVGPAGAYVRTLDEERLAALRDRCAELLPAAPFTLTAYAWAARGLA